VRAAFDGRQLVPGDVEVAGEMITRLGVQPAGSGGIAAPGFVDLQVNGFAGVDLLHAGPEDLVRIEAALAARGVTAWRPTLVSAPIGTVERALATLGRPAEDRRLHLLPAHLEGPFLSPAWPGAHPPQALRMPDVALADRLLAAGPVGHVTLAPELPGAMALIEHLLGAGVSVAVGHSDATAEQAHAAFDAAARSLTHAFNAHRRLLARDPGPAGAALVRDDVWVQVIADGVHVAAEVVKLVHRAAGDRLIAVSDAVAAAGVGDGESTFGDRALTVRGGRVELADGRLAGSAAGLDTCLRQLVAVGLPLEAALAAVTSRPASAAGRDDLGRLTPGGRADVVILDDQLNPTATLVGGAGRSE
jgi:N-acetylglucosamine-6-phosphate deacetylase